MPTQPSPIRKIVVRLQVGDHRMGGTDDPVFLRLFGPTGRDFRLTLAKGRSMRRAQEDVYVLGSPEDGDTNVAHPELNDPTAPQLDAGGIERIALFKGFEPIPNVRGLGEMDDRLLVDSIEVEIHSQLAPKPIRHARTGPIWLGLLCGLSLEIPRADESS